MPKIFTLLKTLTIFTTLSFVVEIGHAEDSEGEAGESLGKREPTMLNTLEDAKTSFGGFLGRYANRSESIDVDRKKQNKVLNGLFVTFWKGAKITLRSTPVDVNTKNLDFFKIKKLQSGKLNLGEHLGQIYDAEAFFRDVGEGEAGDKDESLSAKETVALAKEVYALDDAIKELDEDDLLTVAEIIHHSSRILRKEAVDIPEYWNNSMDHWMFAIVMESRLGFASWKTYELAKVHPHEMPSSDYRIVAHLHKGIEHLQRGWYYLADESFSLAIEETKTADITLQPHTRGWLVKAKIKEFSPEEQFRLIARASSHLLRGFSRHQVKDKLLKENVLADIEAAIADFHRLGVENELLWFAECYVYIYSGEKEKALDTLTKLESSEYFSGRERKLLAEIKEKVIQRDLESALNFLTDKSMMAKLAINYTMSYAREIKWMQLLEKNEQGKKILLRSAELEQTLEKVKITLDVDGLKNTGKSFLDMVTD